MMNARFALMAAFSVISLQSCVTDAQVAAPAPIICKAGPDCDVKWSRAVSWVVTNSAYKIQTQTGDLVQTMGPTDSSSRPAYTVTKTAASPGVYQISLRGGCDNFIGCIPTIPESKAMFAVFVNGS